MTARFGHDGSVTLHSSWRSVAGGYVGPLVFLVVTAIAWARQGFGIGVVLIGGLGVVLLAVLLFDLPVATRFDQAGVERRMPLRRHSIAWGDIRQLTRTRGRVFSPSRFSSNPEIKANRGGLVAVLGRRRYLLVDQVESRMEFDLVMKLLDNVAPDLADETLLPPPDANPTFLYRRRRWRPEQADRR